MDEYDVEISANRSDEEPWRLARLNRIIGYVAALSNDGVLKKVVKLHDHKGELTVTWGLEPTAREMEFFILAWASQIGDGSGELVAHKKPPAKSPDDCMWDSQVKCEI